MGDGFDPYREWLQISDERRPPTDYDLLGLTAFESDAERTRSAAMARMQHLRTFTLGPDRETALKLIAEVTAAMAHLSDPKIKDRYDQDLRAVKIVSETAVDQIGPADRDFVSGSIDPRPWETEAAARSRKPHTPQRKLQPKPSAPPRAPRPALPAGPPRTTRPNKRYASLRSMAVGYRVLAYAFITIGVLVGLVLAVLMPHVLPALWVGAGSVTMALAMDAILVAAVALITAAVALSCFSLAEGVEVVLEIEKHARQARRILKGIAAELDRANRLASKNRDDVP